MSDNETSIIPFGMFELNAEGTIVHYSPATEGRSQTLSRGVVGRNFFNDFFRTSQVEDFKSRFHNFMADGTSVERFTLSFPYNREGIKIQVVMAHLSEKTERGHERFALIRLMPDAYAQPPTLAGA